MATPDGFAAFRGGFAALRAASLWLTETVYIVGLICHLKIVKCLVTGRDYSRRQFAPLA